MEIVQLETFLAVATYGGFHRAAEALRISQPAVSARISSLEQLLGARLFERDRGRFSLSLAGKALRPHAEQVLRQVAIARQAVHELHPIAGGALPIAASLSICTYLLPEVLKKYRETHANVVVSVRSGNSAQVLKMVLDGEVDLGLARSLNHPEVETIQLRDDPLILVGHPGHPALTQTKVTLEQLESVPLISYDRGSSDWTLMNGLFRREGLLPNIVLEAFAAGNCQFRTLAAQPGRDSLTPAASFEKRERTGGRAAQGHAGARSYRSGPQETKAVIPDYPVGIGAGRCVEWASKTGGSWKNSNKPY